MGVSEVQGLVPAQDAGHPLAGAHCAPPDKVVRPLEPALWPWPNNGSRMTRECHVRFCESAGVRSPPPLTSSFSSQEPASKPRKKRRHSPRTCTRRWGWSYPSRSFRSDRGSRVPWAPGALQMASPVWPHATDRNPKRQAGGYSVQGEADDHTLDDRMVPVTSSSEVESNPAGLG